MSYTAETLLELLPAIYRVRDAAQGGPLQGLLTVLAAPADAVHQDIAQLYENWFIETCEEWAVPYIADLLGVQGLHPLDTSSYSARARVANTLLYRQRKGTASMLEQLARDTTGWPARLMECFQLLDQTEYMNHIRPLTLRTPDLRDMPKLELLEGPFDTVAHTVDVRHINSGRGRYNIPNLAIFLWRLNSYPVPRSRCAAVASLPSGCYTFDPLGLSVPLFNAAETPADDAPVQEINVNGALRNRALYDELEALRASVTGDSTAEPVYFGLDPVITIWLDEQLILPAQIAICDLSDPSAPLATGWPRPPATKTYTALDGTVFTQPIKVGIDPSLGRIALPAGATATSIEAGYTYAATADIGAGPYDRSDTIDAWIASLGRPISWQIAVTRNPDTIANAPDPSNFASTITDAITAWNVYSSAHAGAFGLIVLSDSDSYTEDLTGTNGLEVPSDSAVGFIAASWPLRDTGSLTPTRVVGDYVASGLRPHLKGNLDITASTGSVKAAVMLDGLLLEGTVNAAPGDLGTLNISHCTLVPAAEASLTADTSNADLGITIQRSILGAISLGAEVPTLSVSDSILTSAADAIEATTEITALGATAEIDHTTVFGTVSVRALSATGSIFTAPVTATRRQTGCVRFCFLAPGSVTGVRYRCQPDLALTGVTDPAAQNLITVQMTPSFNATQLGDPAFVQLAAGCDPGIATGDETGSEMGAYSYLDQPQRAANLTSSLNEFLRFGLEAGIFFAT